MAEPTGERLGTLVGQLADGIGTLVSSHLQLARVELAEDARRIGAMSAKVAMVVPFLGVGYALLSVALAVWLAGWLGLAGGLAVVGAVNFVAAALALWQVRADLRRHGLLGDSMEELQRSAALLAPASRRNGHGN